MPLNRSKGNMYPWVTHTWNPIKGRCPHRCSYCYMRRFKLREPRLVESELGENLGSGNTIFVGSSIDMWAEQIPDEWISRVLERCRAWEGENTFVFQSKNPGRFYRFAGELPRRRLLGTTIETDTEELIARHSSAPPLRRRLVPLDFVSIEPIMRCNPVKLAGIVYETFAGFVSIGADSQKSGLPEPKAGDVWLLVRRLRQMGIKVRLKDNLRRIYPYGVGQEALPLPTCDGRGRSEAKGE